MPDDSPGGSAKLCSRPVIDLEPLDFWVARRAADERQPVLDFIQAAVDAQRGEAAPVPD